MNVHFINRLKGEKSPYLARHALSPIQWFPWGNEAFAEAERRGCPIFLSIGYSACHWCHTMERESFENGEIAKILNDAFVSIKVDREELPHIDGMYMEFAGSLLSGGGGWPLNLFLTPDLKPFFAFSYAPPENGHGLMGLKEIAIHIQSIWNGEEKELVLAQSETLIQIFQEEVQLFGLELPSDKVYDEGVLQFFEVADPVFGGLQGGPKFPMTYQLEMLLNYAKIREDSRGIYFACLTLDKMISGGIRDQLGGGFFRYASDPKWRFPHFEKMVVENALIAKTLAIAFVATKREEYKEIAVETLRYIEEKFIGDEGQFFSAEGAGVDGVEGLFYTWSLEEIEELLPGLEGQVFIERFGVQKEGNFEGRNVLFQAKSFKEVAKKFAIEEKKVQEIVGMGVDCLLQKRSTRKLPFLDDKAILSSNAMAIESFARCGSIFQNERYKEIALKGIQFVREKMYIDGRLLRRYKDKEVRFDAILEDYAYLISALLTLFESDMGSEFLPWAMELAEMTEILFKSEDGAFYQAEEGATPHFQRCDMNDGSLPSGNGVHLENLLRLYQITTEDQYLHQAEDILKAARDRLVAHAPGSGYLLKGLGRFLDLNEETLYIALNEEGDMEKEIALFLQNAFSPHRAVIWLKGSNRTEKLPINGETTIYICRHGNCSQPLVGKEEIGAKFLESS